MNTKTGKITASIAACLLLLSSVSFAEALKPDLISDIRTVEYNAGVLELDGKRMTYSISYQSNGSSPNSELIGAYSVEYLQNTMVNVWSVMTSFLREKRIPTSDCRTNYNLNIFIISPNEMLKQERFAPFFRANNLRPSLLYAFYDTTPNDYADSAIILSNFGRSQNDNSLSHELAHYWWDRVCVANHYSSNGEAFAVEFEAYYGRHK